MSAVENLQGTDLKSRVHSFMFSDSLRSVTSTTSTASRSRALRRRSIGIEVKKPLLRRVSLLDLVNSSLDPFAVLASKNSSLEIDLDLHTASDTKGLPRSSSFSYGADSRKDQRELPLLVSVVHRTKLPERLDSTGALTRSVSERMLRAANVKEVERSRSDANLESEVGERARASLIERNMKRIESGELTYKEVAAAAAEARKVTEVSERLTGTRDNNASGKVKAKPRKMIEQELDEKISSWRCNEDELQARVSKHREHLKSGKAPMKLFMSTRSFKPDNLEAIRAIRSQKYKERRDLVMKSHRENLQKSSDDALAVLQIKEQKRVEYRREAELAKKQQKEEMIAKLLLPAMIAVNQLCHLRQVFHLRRTIQAMQEAAERLQRFVKWKFWYFRFKNNCFLKKMFRKYMWRALMAHRIRKKRRSVALVVEFVKDSLRYSAFAQVLKVYKYKVLLIQRQLRRMMALRAAHLRLAQKQYDDVVQQQRERELNDPLNVKGLLARSKAASSRNLLAAPSSPRVAKPGTLSWNSINFKHMPNSSESFVLVELEMLLTRRRRAFAEELHRWRQEKKEWLRDKKQMYDIEEQAKNLLSQITKDPSRLLALPKRSAKNPAALWLLGFDESYTWQNFLEETPQGRERNPRYRQSGPPRPLYDVNLDLTLELFPLFLRIFRRARHAEEQMSVAAGRGGG
ncbi:hypothetical protein GUITHDRAFT_135206 [Guillardia theta CCMP2712]|uniref:Uncharacterized protein n=1 Tax=Guillardia theta (strain CCMP2712) TaxID=905079 RepID=L1JQK2_GUITC|nr:hypothetical protein GUITHDRAFT_135206 [Guillardia theta CCMP2712]EKX50569.1 hypothetical protein GUITHDRAFT_135206 [Guillardia theta CCMP2712]|eukprot:XP_005837549.1 hypothetical protein GUITHDRAFT_135206 [Guillardia theta CCMP2712]